MNAKIRALIDALIDREGGFVDHPHDKGGPTNWGITEQVARAYGYTGDMRALPRATAVTIYTSRYWFDPGFDRVDRSSSKVAEELFDTGVNMGTGKAGQFLQRALNGLNRQAQGWPDLSVDGRIGRMTLHALAELLRQRGKDGEVVLLRMLNALQSVRYLELAETAPTQESFLFGWQLHRVQMEAA